MQLRRLTSQNVQIPPFVPAIHPSLLLPTFYKKETDEEKTGMGIVRWISVVSAVMQALYSPAVVKIELSQKVKHSIHRPIYIPTFIYGHKFWVVTERARPWIQAVYSAWCPGSPLKTGWGPWIFEGDSG